MALLISTIQKMFIAKKQNKINLAKQHGFTLLEALIAFFVLSIGLIGIISLLTLSKSTQHQSLQRTRAIALANDLLERIRSNPGGIQTYGLKNKSSPLGGNSIPTPSQNSCTHSDPCSTEEKALQDLWEWEHALDGNEVIQYSDSAGNIKTSGLIFPSACINFEPVVGKKKTGAVSITIEWRGLTKLSDGIKNSDNECKEMSSEEKSYRRAIQVSTYIAGDLTMPNTSGES